jgi:hypothetical protein
VYRPLQFEKRRRNFLGAHDEALSVTMRVNNPETQPKLKPDLLRLSATISQSLTESSHRRLQANGQTREGERIVSKGPALDVANARCASSSRTQISFSQPLG